MYIVSSNQKALIMKGTTYKALKLFQKKNLVILKLMRKYLFFFTTKYFIWKKIPIKWLVTASGRQYILPQVLVITKKKSIGQP